jgi:putative lipoic acid-binding regulatory protein
MSEEADTLIEFPCEFPIKAMGPANVGLDEIVVSIVRGHVEDIKEGSINTKHSSGGKFTSITVTITATSKKQLDAIYQQLSDHEHVKYVL